MRFKNILFEMNKRMEKDMDKENEDKANGISKQYIEADYSISSENTTINNTSLTKYINITSSEIRRKHKNFSKAILKILFIALLLVIVITLSIGVIIFFITMPGISMEKLKNLSEKIGIDFSKLYHEDTVETSDDKIYEVLDYLREVGYDLKSFGFLTSNADRDESDIQKDSKDDGLLLYENGENEGKIKDAKSDFILVYLLSDNYKYNIANYDGSEGLRHVIDRASGSGLWTRMSEILDSIDNWGDGLLGIYIDDGYGKKGENYTSLDWSKFKFDFDKKTLSIKKTWGTEYAKFNINGWTGKFGMPLELLISSNLATLMPDFSYDLATKFDTQVVILLHKGGNKGPYYKDGDTVYKKGWLKEILSLDDLEWEERDIPISRGRAEDILSAIEHAEPLGGGAYTPYLARVENHWFRDIYFVRDDEQSLIDSDTNYEEDVKERYTIYETYTEENSFNDYALSHLGEAILYELDDNGNYEKDADGDLIPFDGSYAEALERGIKVGKKPKEAEEIRLEEFGWSDDIGVWSAYLDEGASSSEINAYEKPHGDLQEKIMVKVSTPDLSQIGDGLRTETNLKIKEMFSKNVYFKYDGTEKTADIINELRTKAGIPYGSINTDSENYTNEYVLSDGNKYRVQDYSSNLSANQDILNMLSMLENTHTLDASYVYRDLKELLLELDYYDKEELTKETPRLLEFLVPQIGSYGYPKRELDKPTNEYGTLLHAKADYLAYETTREVVIDNKNEKYTVNDNVDTSSAKYTSNGETDINLATNNLDRSELSVKKEFIQNMEELYYAEGYDGSIDASPYDKSDPRYPGTEGSLYREYISIMKEKKPDFYLAYNINKDEILGEYVTNKVSLLDSLSETIIAIPGEKRDLLAGGSESQFHDIIEKNLVDAGWDDILPVFEEYRGNGKQMIRQENNLYTTGDESSYISWLNELGGVFSEYAGADKKMGGQTLEDFVNANKYVYGLFSIVGFEYCNGKDWHCGSFFEKYSGYQTASYYDAYYPGFHHGRGCVKQRKMDECMLAKRYLTNCNYTTDKVYHKAGLFGGEGQPDASCGYISLVEKYGAQIIFDPSELHVGDFIECFEDNNNNSTNPHDWSGWHHVMFVGEETEEELILYTTGHDYTAGGSFRLPLSKEETRDGSWYPNKPHSGWVGLHLYEFESSGLYEGYNGNEAVVSPVTGVLLEYGTYDDNNARVNTDLEYDTNSKIGKDLGFGEMTVHDKVGYAKILVLDAQNYQKLESLTDNRWKDASLISIKENGGYTYREDLFDKDEEKEFSQIDKTVYGYKEFVEAYDKYDISGYIIYIDGFSPELPGIRNKDGMIEVKDEDKLSMNYFIENARHIDSDSDFKTKIKSRYKIDSEYQDLSTEDTEEQNNITDRLKGERLVKKDAESAVYIEFGDDDKLLLIKEGTVIGRTFTNQEIFKMRENNPEAENLMKRIKLNDDGIAVLDSEAESPVVQGNYLKIIMRNRENEIIENVEDYMKLDTRPKSSLFDETKVKEIQLTDSEINLIASIIQGECISEKEFPAMAWIIRNRYEAKVYGEKLEDVINSSIFTNRATPSQEAINIVKSVFKGEKLSPIADRCDFTKCPLDGDINKVVPAEASPVQIEENGGNIYHYDISNIIQGDTEDVIERDRQRELEETNAQNEPNGQGEPNDQNDQGESNEQNEQDNQNEQNSPNEPNEQEALDEENELDDPYNDSDNFD